MKYQEGKINRVYILAFDHNEEVLRPLINFIKEKNIRAGFINLLGAMQSGTVVCGPKESVLPPDPIKKEIKEANELLAVGTIFWAGAEPKIHLHAAMGRGDQAFVACIREAAKVYITLEVMIQEITGVTFEKKEHLEAGLLTL